MEATTTGIKNIEENAPAFSFPVFDWNQLEMKDRIHNQFHVGYEFWFAFSYVTSLSLIGRRIAVLGFGPVGQGIAHYARALGAQVAVIDRDPNRVWLAQHLGHDVGHAERILKSAEVLVTATGISGCVGDAELSLLPDGAILCSAGHTGDEIIFDDTKPAVRSEIREGLEAIEGEKTLYLLNKGGMLNLVPGRPQTSADLFDPYSALVGLGVLHILTKDMSEPGGGLHPFPSHIAERIVRMTTGLQ